MHTVASQASQHIDLHNFIWISANEKTIWQMAGASQTQEAFQIKSVLEDTFLVTTRQCKYDLYIQSHFIISSHYFLWSPDSPCLH